MKTLQVRVQRSDYQTRRLVRQDMTSKLTGVLYLFQIHKKKYLHYPNLLIYLCNPITHNRLVFLYLLKSLLRLPRILRP